MNDTIYVLFESDGEMRPTHYTIGWFESREGAVAEAHRRVDDAIAKYHPKPAPDYFLKELEGRFFIRSVKKGGAE